MARSIEREELSERQELLDEITQLEREIAAFKASATPSYDLRTVVGRTEEEEDQNATMQAIRQLLAANDSALLAARPRKNKTLDDAREDSKELQLAYELIQANAQFSGIEFTSTESRLLSVETTHQVREHTLIGTLPSSLVPLGFRIRLRVHEPPTTNAFPAASSVDPGSEYRIIAMDVNVWGGGAELQRAIEALRLSDRPNPPALFSTLRQFSLLATQRTTLFDRLRSRLAHFIPTNEEPSTSSQRPTQSSSSALSDSLRFTNASKTLSLLLTYFLPPFIDGGRLIPTLSLTSIMSAQTRASIPSSSLEVLDEIPDRFTHMIAEGFPLEHVIELLVTGVLGE